MIPHLEISKQGSMYEVYVVRTSERAKLHECSSLHLDTTQRCALRVANERGLTIVSSEEVQKELDLQEKVGNPEKYPGVMELLLCYSLYNVMMMLQSPSCYTEDSLAPLVKAGLLEKDLYWVNGYNITCRGRELHNLLLTIRED